MTERRPSRRSITDYLTDASLAALVQDLGALVGAGAALHAPDGARISLGGADASWTAEPPRPEDEPVAEAIARAGAPGPPTPIDGRRRARVIVAAGRGIGAIVAGTPREGADDGAFLRVIDAVARTAEEFCEQAAENERRNQELSALIRLSSLLVAAHTLDDVLRIALRTTMEMLDADAGAVHLLAEDNDWIDLVAHEGLGPAFVEAFASIPSGMIMDAEALAEEPLVIDDLPSHPDVALRDWVEQEGLVGRVSVPLRSRRRTFGLLRLYTRRRRDVTGRARVMAGAAGELVSGALAAARLLESERQQRQTRRQMRLAADVQRRLLPSEPPRIAGLDTAARYLSSLDLGGDFYDLIDLGGHLGFAVGDVVGKGLPAALLMASVRATLRAHAADLYDLDEIIARVNAALTRDSRPEEFTTVFYGVIDPASRRLTYCNAGHDPPVVFRRAGDEDGGATRVVATLDAGGMVVGVDAAQAYERGSFDLRPGDVLLANSDGLTDALNFQDEKFGRARLFDTVARFLDATPDATAEAVVQHAVWEVRRFIGLRPEIDDITVLAIRVV